MLYEPRHVRPISRHHFILRLVRHTGAALLLAVASIGIGMWGYTHYEHLAWRDAFLNASMLLGGMGPVDAPRTPNGKVFAAWYALYAGLVFIASSGVILAPVVHRIVHRVHWEEARNQTRK